jgi:murein L,D-transpeptidase YcbB/YkuD
MFIKWVFDMKVIKIIVLAIVILLSYSYADWLEEQNDIVTTEEVLTPDEPIVIKEEPIKSDDSWTGSLGSDKLETKVIQSNFLAIINGKSFGTYSIDKLYRKKEVKSFYSAIGYTYYWFSNGFKITPQIRSLLSAIEEAPSEALDDLTRYHYDEIFAYIAQIKDKSYDKSERDILFKTLDVLLTDAFFSLAHDLHNGILNYKNFQRKLKARREKTEINYKWDTPKAEPDYINLLSSLYSTNTIKKGLYDLVNHSFVYERLKDAYQNYKVIEANGGWPKIPAGSVLRYGSKGKRVDLLAKRLFISGDLENYYANYNTFDKALKLALKKYQKRMGLWVSGKLTGETRRSLNISVKAKLKLIKLNIEKARWETDPMQRRLILVNIPDFMLRFYEDESVILASRVVVGKKTNPTPIFSSVMSYIVLNPTWTVPDSIVKKEMLPKFKEDPTYLEGKKFKIYDGWGKNRKEVNPVDINWDQYSEKDKIPYVFVREKGKENPLGIVKFMFPNNNAVYIHDTPSKNLFKKRVRAFSHGCIRLHNPQTLLELIANEHMSSGYEKVNKILKSGKNKSLRIDNKIPVYIRYYTVFVDDDGTVKFSHDIYKYDKILLKDIL